MGPDSREGYGCDNMSVVIVRLKDVAKQGTGEQQSCTVYGQASSLLSFRSTAALLLVHEDVGRHTACYS